MKTSLIHSYNIYESWRLDAKYYLSSGVLATNLIKDLKQKGIECITLGDEISDSKIWSPLRFKSMYASEDEQKVSYLRPYDVFKYLPTATHYLSVNRTKDIDTYKLIPGTILQTCSGRNLGPLTMVDNYLSMFVIGSDMLRIEINDEVLRFYVYAYFRSKIGQQILRRGKTGSVIDHISPEHVKTIEIPRLDKDITQKISAQMQKAFILRQEARIKLFNLQQDYESALPKLCRESNQKYGWAIQSVALNDRLDSAYYDPFVRLVREKLVSIGGKYIEDLAYVEKPKGRYKTVYVEPEYGIPILSGTQLLQENPINLRYIAPRAFKDVSSYQLKPHTICYQADGRVEGGLGVPALVTNDRIDWLASGHIGRLIAKDEKNVGWILLACLTWYTLIQIRSMASGSVVDSTFPEDMEKVILPPNLNIDGDLICCLWDQFANAKKLEDEAINSLESYIYELAK